jgi:hypothetical protein
MRSERAGYFLVEVRPQPLGPLFGKLQPARFRLRLTRTGRRGKLTPQLSEDGPPSSRYFSIRNGKRGNLQSDRETINEEI